MVDPAHAVLAGELAELVDQGDAVELAAADRHRLAAVERDLDFLGLVGRQPRVDGPLKRLGRRLDPGVFEDAGLDRAAPQVLVGAEDRLLGRLDLDAVLGGVLELLGPRPLPFAHRGDDLEVGRERLERHVEPDLVVPLAGAAVRDRGRAMLPRDADHELGDQRTPEGRRQRVFPLVKGTGRQRRKHEVVDEQVARVFGDRVDRAGLRAPSGGSPRCPGPGPGRRCRRSHPCCTFR